MDRRFEAQGDENKLADSTLNYLQLAGQVG